MNGRLPIDQLRRVAHRELLRNPTITVYGWRDDCEYRRRPANPMPRLHAMVERMTEALAQIGVAFEGVTGAANALPRREFVPPSPEHPFGHCVQSNPAEVPLKISDFSRRYDNVHPEGRI